MLFLVDSNLNGLLTGGSGARPERLINALRVVDSINYNLSNFKVLSVGPRSEMEILSLVAFGFSAENVRGLDLLSYSPLIDLGDMHEMPYPDSTFDVILLGWVLAYSKNLPQAAAEVKRVARPGAIIAIGCEYNPESTAELQKTSLLKSDYPRFFTTEDILKVFDGMVENTIIRHDVPKNRKHLVGSLTVVFELKK